MLLTFCPFLLIFLFKSRRFSHMPIIRSIIGLHLIMISYGLLISSLPKFEMLKKKITFDFYKKILVSDLDEREN